MTRDPGDLPVLHTNPTTAIDAHLFAPLAALEEPNADAHAILRKVAHSFATLATLLPQTADVLEGLKPVIVLDVAASHQPGAMALVAELGLFPRQVDEAGATMLRAAFKRATPAQRSDLFGLMVAIAPVH
jgi:hypothetical protein